MTRVTFWRNGENWLGFETDGHAGAGDEGEDIVCAAISALTQTTWLGLTELCKLEVPLEADDGFMRLRLPDTLSKAARSRANLLLATLVLGLQSTQAGYPAYIEVLEKEVPPHVCDESATVRP